MKKNYRQDTTCLNCATQVSGKFCSNCGQENIETKEHVGHMLTHAIGDYFHFDSKFIKTMKPLMFQPGLLTNEYNAGKRTTYLPAIRMYIFISIVFFLSISVKNSPAINIGSNNNGQRTEFNLEDAMAASRSAKTNEEIDNIKLLSPGQKKEAKARLEDRIEDNFKKLTAEQYAAEQKALPAASRDGYISYYFQHKGLQLKERENIEKTFFETLVHNLPKMMFLLLPLFALILLLIFRKSRMFYAEHFIYALHLHSFLYLLLLIPIFMLKVLSVAPAFIYWIVFLVITFYIYRSLRTVYKNSRKKTIVKMVILGTSYSFLLGICLFLLLISTFLIL